MTLENISRRSASIAAALGILISTGVPTDVVARDDGDPAAITFRGYLEGRIVSTSSAVSWADGGLGKTRFGGTQADGARVLGRVEAAVKAQAKIGWDWTANVTATVSGQQYHLIDAQEAFLRYKPAPTGALALEAKVGVFIPPISLENTGIAWTSPFTLSPSALNAWVGDEIRSLGGEFSAARRVAFGDESIKVRATGGLFGFDDPAGALLAWRGWAVHDRTAGVLERHPLSPLRSLRPGGTVPQQAPWAEPFHELDGRPGYYAGVSLEDEMRDEVRVLYYDNRANTRVFDGRQYAWHTRFTSVGAKTLLPGDIEIVTQAMTGRTTMNLQPSPLGAIVDADFTSAFLLASRAWDKHRLSLRVEYFDARDLDKTPDDNNAERGNAVTAAYIFRPTDNHRLTFEIAHVHSDRAERVFQELARRQNETTTQVSWRTSF